ncbi:MAG: PEGA domain-containing protein, partial [Myxococcaceae bacterium]|nr:PEGA domain-containing protein [Myxococcaceae bacterium]
PPPEKPPPETPPVQPPPDPPPVQPPPDPIVEKPADAPPVDVPPKPAVAEVGYTFKTKPGSAVIVDGRSRGTAPVELDLKPGKHSVVFVEGGTGQKKTLNFVVKAGKPGTVEWEFPDKAPAPVVAMGTLQLEATPFATKYVVDGKQVAASKSFHELELAAGRHTIEFVIEDPSLTKTIKRVVELKGGGNEKVAVNFLTDT